MTRPDSARDDAATPASPADPATSSSAPAAADDATAGEDTRAPRRGGMIAGIVAGGVVALALAFSGGVAVGLVVDGVSGSLTGSADSVSDGPGFERGDRPQPGEGREYGPRGGDQSDDGTERGA